MCFLCARRSSLNRIDDFIKNVSLDMHDQMCVGKFEPAAETSDSYDDLTEACSVRSFPGESETSFNFIFVENLDDSFSVAETRHHEERALSFLRGLSDFSGKVRDSAVMTQRGL